MADMEGVPVVDDETKQQKPHDEKSGQKPNGKKKGKGKGPAQTKERIQRLDQLYSKKKRQIYFVPTPKSDFAHDTYGKNEHVVLKVRRLINDKGYPDGVDIDIKSDRLKDTLSEIFDGVEGLALNETPPVVKPEFLFHARKGLLERVKAEQAKPEPSQALIDDLNVACQYVNEDYGNTLETLESLASHDEITFNLLWALFPPNATIYTKNNQLQEEQVMKLQSAEYNVRPNCSRYLLLTLRLISHDGEKAGWVEKTIEIDQFDGAKKVHHLKAFPLSHHPDEESVRNYLLQRGRIWAETLQAPSGTYREYTGAAITENRDVVIEGEYKRVVLHVSGRVMFDSSTFLQQNEYTDLLKPSVETEMHLPTMMEADLLYCNHYVGGFSFRNKKWCCFAVSRMAPVIWNENAFSKLVMDTRRRDLIHTLVKSHKHDHEKFDDVVSGKGRGLVGLLSGNPGVGKTLTAEVIAEATKRPLYALSAGELGMQVEDVEKKLDMVLEVTRQWGCVLLIDEADVFLQERDGVSLDRNALVSIFLRRLEYFQGVLIMTTNRKNTIDAAFDSRIHFKLHYADLTAPSRKTIWRNCLGNINTKVTKCEIGEAELDELAALKLNGRQIKNAMACAVSIATEDKQPLTLEGIQIVLDMVVDRQAEE